MGEDTQRRALDACLDDELERVACRLATEGGSPLRAGLEFSGSWIASAVFVVRAFGVTSLAAVTPAAC